MEILSMYFHNFIIKMRVGLSYWLKNKLYLAVTNNCNSLSPIVIRGPSFVMPKESGFQMLNFEPTSQDLVKEVEDAFQKGLIRVDSMESDEITFAGCGEPLLRMDVVTEAARLIKDNRHGVPLRVKTNGLIKSNTSFNIAQELQKSGIEHLSIALMADNPKQYQQIMSPKDNLNFGDVCSFVMASAEVGLTVTCTAVERPDVNIGKVRSLAQSLGAQNFQSYSFHP